MNEPVALRLHRTKPRVFWGHVIRVLLDRGWTPPPPDERIVDDLLHAMEHLPADPLFASNEVDMRGLTPAEQDVCRFLVVGMNNPEIAEALGLSVHTVKFHLVNVYSKLGVDSRGRAIAELMMKAPE